MALCEYVDAATDRAAEDELMAVADEKDKLVPQLEEARWRNRQLEKDVQRLQESGGAADQVSRASHCCTECCNLFWIEHM